MPTGEVQLQPPPSLPPPGGAQLMQLMFFVPMMLGMGLMSFFFIGRSSGPMTMVYGVMYVGMMGGMLVMMLARGGATKKAEINRERRDYLRYLANLRLDVRDTALAQRAHLTFLHPDPTALGRLIGGSRLWERRRGDADAFHVRIATGPQRLATPLRSPQTVPLEDLDPITSTSLRHFMRTYATVPDLPVAVAIRSFSQLVLQGEDREATLAVARAWLASLVALHSPEDLTLAVLAAPERLPDWDWVKWLPHAQHPSRRDASGSVVMVGSSLGELEGLLAPVVGDRPRLSRDASLAFDLPQVVLVCDDPGLRHGGALLPEGGLHGLTPIDVAGVLPTKGPELRVVVEQGRLGVVTGDRVAYVGEADLLGEAAALELARRLAPVELPRAARSGSSLTSNVGLPDLLGIGDPRHLDVRETWRPRSRHERLRIPFGLDPSGLPVELDFKESAEGGMGPHGLVIGATGSGKSELLRTLVTGLAVTHSSENLNLALVDFKGGATFAGLGSLPHTSAVITNLEDDLAMVDRMKEALHGELIRRQELLKAAGNYASARDYERAREAGADLAPLPTLMVIIDEFSELLSSKPDFIEVFVMIGRLGRSLGVHLMLASQRLDEGRLRGLDSHLSYRIGLRTFSSSESRSVLGVPDAYELPSLPGSGFLKEDTATMIRFKAAFVSGILPPEDLVADAGSSTPSQAVLPFRVDAGLPELVVEVEEEEPLAPDDPQSMDVAVLGESMMEAMVRRIEGQGPPARQVWLPPLGEAPSLDRLLPPLAPDPQRGLCPAQWHGNGRLVVPWGVVDKPFEQIRDLLWVNLTGSAGHTAVIGAPQTGKSTALRTLIASLALTHTPTEVQVFALDFGGGTLGALAGLPHVAGVADRQDEERCRRIVATVTRLLTDRERLFREEGLDSMDAFRRRYAATGDPSGYGDVVLVVDNWLTLRQDFEPLEEALAMLANRGLAYGIHLVVSANRWWDLRMQIRDMFGTRVELRLGDPTDSEIDRHAATNVPAESPGRGITGEGRQCLIGLPRIDASSAVTDLSEAVAALVSAVAQASSSAAPALGLLPRRLQIGELPADGPALTVPLGLAESTLGAVGLDFAADPHLLVFGDVECGKSNLLRLVASQIQSRLRPDQARIVIADYRRSLIEVSAAEHVIGYAGSAPILADAVGEVAQALRQRLPTAEVTAEQLRARSWWKGPHIFVLVDDYDMVASAAENPLLPLVELLGQARDIGFHLVVTRRAGGASRALYDPVLGRLRELSSPGLVMAGPPDEGQLVGDVKPGPLPPGRGWLVRRREGKELVQIAWCDPGSDGASGD